jgi:hypothetical protein
MKILSFILGYFVGKFVTKSGSWSAASAVATGQVKRVWLWLTSMLSSASK